MLVGAVVLALLVTAAWFPASALYRQHQQLATTDSQLQQLRQQDQALQQERKRLGSSSEVTRIARQQYQLVEPGQQAYEVLPPPNGSGAGTSYAGDPGLQDPVRPSGASELPPGSAHSSSSSSRSASHGNASSSSVVGRIVQTLEFWR
jgi:cell division protein FtsB